MRTILHSDINSCFANIECLHRPHLRDLPVAVCGDVELRHGIVLAKNQAAKAYNIKTGETIMQAKEKCPELVLLPPDYPLYSRFCGYVREIYADYTDRIEPFGIDESWLETTGCERLFGEGAEIAEKIRNRVRNELGITVSIGVSWNKIFAKLGSDLRKPDAVTAITPENFKEIVWPLPVGELLYVGRATKAMLMRYNIRTIGALALCEPHLLRRLLGKVGGVLHAFANGQDVSGVALSDSAEIIKSIGNSSTPPRDLEDEDDIKILLYLLSDSVAARLRENGFMCKGVQISVRDNTLKSYERQMRLERPTVISHEIYEAAMSLFRKSYEWERGVRSAGVRAIDLVAADSSIQLTIFQDEERRYKNEKLEYEIDSIRARFGNTSLRRGIVIKDPAFWGIEPRGNYHSAHPVSFFKPVKA